MAAMTKTDLREYVEDGKRKTMDGYVILDLKHNLTSVRLDTPRPYALNSFSE